MNQHIIDNISGIAERIAMPSKYIKLLLSKVSIYKLKEFIDNKIPPIYYEDYDHSKVPIIDIILYRFINDIINVSVIYLNIGNKFTPNNYIKRDRYVKITRNTQVKIINNCNDKLKYFSICNHFLNLINSNNTIIDPSTNEVYNIEIGSVFQILIFYQILFNKNYKYDLSNKPGRMYVPSIKLTDLEINDIIKDSCLIVPNTISRILKCNKKINKNFFTKIFNLNLFINNYKKDIISDIKFKLSRLKVDINKDCIIIPFKIFIPEFLDLNTYTIIIIDVIFLTIVKHLLCITLKYIIILTGNKIIY